MGSCRLCGSDAGFLKSVHKACKEAEEDRAYAEQAAISDAEKKLRQTISDAIKDDTAPEQIWPPVEAEREKGKVPIRAAEELMLDAANRACLSLAPQDPISTERLQRIFDLFNAIKPKSLDPQNITQQRGYLAVALNQVVYDVLDGTVPYWNPDAQVGKLHELNSKTILHRLRIICMEKT
jgi:hypothetical protein